MPIDRQEFKRELLRLLKDDNEVRDALVSLLKKSNPASSLAAALKPHLDDLAR